MKTQSSPSKIRANIAPYIIIGFCIFGMIGLSLIEVVPRYIVLSIPPPEDSYDLIGWRTTTKSVLTESIGSGFPTSRDFIWRRDTILVYEDFDHIPTWNMLVGYFDEQFSQIGWKRNDASPPCNVYLPESAFLKYGKDGYLSYRRINDTDEIPLGDTICLAIWNDNGSLNVFRVVLLTVKRSVLTNFYNIFD